MKVTVQFFSFFRQLTGLTETEIELPDGATVADCFTRFPALKNARSSTLVAIGVEFARWDTLLRDGDRVAFMPPLQGGADDELLLTDQPIDPAEARVPPGRTATGAVVVFWGVVRDQEATDTIRALEYTAYRAMAEHQFRKLIDAVKTQQRVQQVRIVHRLGEVPVGEASLLVRVEAAHRAAAFLSANWIVDELKRTVPIWKRAIGRDDS